MGLLVAEIPMIDMTSSNGKKNEAARSEHVASAMSRMTCTIADSIAQCIGLGMPSVPKSGSHSEKLAIMKSDKVDSAAKVALRPIPSAAEIDSSAGKEETASVGNCEKSIKPAFGKAIEIHALLQPDLLEGNDACAKFVDGVRKVVCPSSFAKHIAEYTKITLLLMIQKMAILAAESMLIDQEDTKVANEVAKVVASETYSSAEKIKRLKYELVVLKGSNISAPTSLQVETTRQEIVDLKTRFNAIQVKYESAKNEIGCHIPQIQDLERVFFSFVPLLMQRMKS
ncbi:hypothetical protein TB2_038006 [Malus domestica]